MSTPEPLLTVRQVAGYLMCAEETVKRLARRGALRATRVGRQLRFYAADIDAYLAAQAAARNGGAQKPGPGAAPQPPPAAHPDALDRLQSLLAVLSHASDPAQAASLVLAASVQVLEATSGAVGLRTPDEQYVEIIATTGYPPGALDRWTRLPISAPLPLPDVVRSGAPLFVEEPAALASRYPALAQASRLNSAWAVLPLTVGSRTIGSLILGFAEPRGFPPADRRMVAVLAQICAQTIERDRLASVERQARAAEAAALRRQTLLASAAALLETIPDERATLAQLARLVVPAHADYCTIHLVNGAGLELVEIAHIDPAGAELVWQMHRRFPPDPARPDRFGALVQGGTPLLLPEITAEQLAALAYDAEHAELLSRLGPTSGLLVPLKVRGGVLGAMTWNSVDPGRRYTPADLALAEELARRAAGALEHARLYAAAQAARKAAEAARNEIARAHEHTQGLQRVTAALAGARTPGEVALAVVREGLAATSMDAGALFALADGGQTFISLADAGYPESLAPRHRRVPATAANPLSEAVRTREIVAVRTGAEIVARWPHLAAAQALTGDQSILAMPLIVDDRALGVLYLASRSVRLLGAAEQEQIRAISSQCAQALERARLYAEVRDAHAVAEARADRISRLQSLTAALASALSPEEITTLTIGQGAAALHAQAGMIILRSDDGQALEIRSAQGYHAADLERWQRFTLDTRLPVTDALRSGELVLLHSSADLLARYPHLAGRVSDRLQARAAIPLVSDGESLGVLLFSYTEPHAFLPEEQDLMLLIGRQCAQALGRARLYAAERAARAEAEAAVKLRESFLLVAAHELRTPLTSLLGQAQLLERRLARAGLDGPFQRSAQVVITQARRLHRMIMALLDVSRLSQNVLKLEVAPLDLAELVRQVVDELQPMAPRHQIVASLPPQPATIAGDGLRLAQVLHNLLENAVKYSPQGGPVRVWVHSDPGHAYVVVGDEGIGIPEAARPQLFTRFFRAANADAYAISGLGVGLFVVADIVRLHGGQVEFASKEGRGSTFAVALPRAGPAGAAGGPGR